MSAIGIDFGSTHSSVGIWLNDKVEIIANDQGNRTSPSLIAFNEQEQLAGEAAKSQLDSNPTNTVFDIKSMLGRKFSDAVIQEKVKQWPFKVVKGKNDEIMVEVTLKGKKQQYSGEDLAGMVLQDMVNLANKYTGKKATHAVLAVPSYFDAAQNEALLRAAAGINLKVMRVVSEATAAAIAYDLDDVSVQGLVNKNVCVVDFGGGSFEASVLRIQSGVMTFKAHASDIDLGGELLVKRLVDHFKEKFEKKHNVTLSGDDMARAMAKLKSVCLRAKSSLSSGPQTSIELDSWFGGKDLYDNISRARFEMLINDVASRVLVPVKEALQKAGVDKSEVDELILVGGCTRIPKVKQILKNFVGEAIVVDTVNPNEAIAYGAAVQANLLSKHADDDLTKMPSVPVTSLTVGLAVAGGAVVPVVPRGTPLPCKTSFLTSTALDNQESVQLSVYQGERAKAADNKLVGKFALQGIAKAARGVPQIQVTFAMDAEGALTVTAVDKSTKKDNTLTVAKGSDKADEKAVEAAKQKAGEDRLYLAQLTAFRELNTYVESVKAQIADKTLEDANGAIVAACSAVAQWLATAEKAQKIPSLEEITGKRAEVEASQREDEEESEEDDEGDETESEEEDEDEDLD